MYASLCVVNIITVNKKDIECELKKIKNTFVWHYF